MAAFFSSLFGYVVKALVLLGVGLCGLFVGIRLRRSKDAKQEAAASPENAQR